MEEIFFLCRFRSVWQHYCMWICSRNLTKIGTPNPQRSKLEKLTERLTAENLLFSNREAVEHLRNVLGFIRFHPLVPGWPKWWFVVCIRHDNLCLPLLCTCWWSIARILLDTKHHTQGPHVFISSEVHFAAGGIVRKAHSAMTAFRMWYVRRTVIHQS